jgi:hypothetical protein
MAVSALFLTQQMELLIQVAVAVAVEILEIFLVMVGQAL